MNLDWSGDPFLHSDDIYDYFKEKREKDNEELRKWEENFKNKYQEDSSFKDNWDLLTSEDFPSFDGVSGEKYASRILGSKMGTSKPHFDIPAMVDLWRDGKLDLENMVSSTYPLENINDALNEMRSGSAIRTVICPGV